MEKNMNEATFDLLSLKDEINNCKENLIYLLEISKQNDKLINDINELYSLKTELNSLKQEINSIKEVNSKTIDFLLLELESNLDKQKQFKDISNSKLTQHQFVENSNNESLINMSDLNVSIFESEKFSNIRVCKIL